MAPEVEKYQRDFARFSRKSKHPNLPKGYDIEYIVFLLADMIGRDEALRMTYPEAMLWIQFKKYSEFQPEK